MRRLSKKLFSCGALALLAGCQVVQQAVDAVGSIGATNENTPVEVAPWQPLKTSLLPASTGHNGEVLAVAQVSQSPVQIVSFGMDGNAIGWSLDSGAGYLLKSVGSAIQLAAVGSRLPLVAYTLNGKIIVSCLNQCTGEWVLDRLKPRVLDIAFHEGDTALLIAGADGRIYRWRYEADRQATSFKEKDKALERYIAHQTLISRVLPHPAGRAFFSVDWDGTLLGWLPYAADDHGGEYDRNLFGGRFFGGVGTFLNAARAPDRGISSAAVSETGERLALGAEDGSVEVWEVRGFALAARKQSHSGRVLSVALSHDGSRVASIGRDSKLVVSQLEPDRLHRISPTALPLLSHEVLSQQLGSGTRNLHFISNGNLIFSTKDGRIGEIRLSDVKTPEASASPAPAAVRKPTVTDSDY